MQKRLKKKNGFSALAVILIIVAVIVAIGIWTTSGQTNVSNANMDDIYASAIITDAEKIKLGFQKIEINGGIHSYFVGGGSGSNIIKYSPLSTPGDPYNVLDPKFGIKKVVVNKAALNASIPSSEGVFTYSSLGMLTNLGNVSKAEHAIVLYDIRDSVCKSINKTLNGTSTIPALVFNNPHLPEESNLKNYETIDMRNVSDVNGWVAGCVSYMSGADRGVYFQILKVN